MDGVLVRFLRNLKIEDLSPYENITLQKCTFDKANNLLTVEIRSKDLMKYCIYFLQDKPLLYLEQYNQM